MKTSLLLAMVALLSACQSNQFVQRKYTSYKNGAHGHHFSPFGGRGHTSSATNTVSKAPASTVEETVSPERTAMIRRYAGSTLSSVRSLTAKTMEPEEEEERMSYGTWFLMILVIPACIIAGLITLFSEFWVGMLLIAVGVLFFFVWINADPELKWFK